MAYIQSAYYGDEKQMRNITQVLQDKILGTTLNVDVNEQLIPPFEVTEKTELTPEEERKIRASASAQCGGNDQECINAKEAQLRQDSLAAKERASNSSATVIKGRRLTVNIVDEDGQRRRLVIPDGQKFKLDKISINDPRLGVEIPKWETVQNQFKLMGALILSTAVYVFGVVATYTVFMRTFHQKILFVVPLVAISIFIPFSGYVMIFLYFLFQGAIDRYLGNV
jgi:hypothetical protein